jgi:DNA-binding Xre family transcriptional regulator
MSVSSTHCKPHRENGLHGRLIAAQTHVGIASALTVNRWGIHPCGMSDNVTLSERVAEEIRAMLGRQRMSGRQLASKLGVSQTWMSTRLAGTTPIDLNDLERIAGILDVDVFELLPAREGRVVTHAGATRRQTTVPKIGSLTSLTKRPTHTTVSNRNSPIPSNQRVTRIVAAAA